MNDQQATHLIDVAADAIQELERLAVRFVIEPIGDGYRFTLDGYRLGSPVHEHDGDEPADRSAAHLYCRTYGDGVQTYATAATLHPAPSVRRWRFRQHYPELDAPEWRAHHLREAVRDAARASLHFRRN